MLSFTGVHIGKTFGAPTIRDIAVQSMRMVRFGGAYQKHFWPIGMHSMLVADLLPPELEHHGLLHDAAEIAGLGDVCRPLKTQEARELEDSVTTRIYQSLGLIELAPAVYGATVKAADLAACSAEGTLGCGPRGYRETQTGYKRDPVAEGLLNNYLAAVKSPLEYLDADGPWALKFERRLRRAIRRLSQIDYTKGVS